MTGAIPWLVAAGIACGPALAKIDRTWLRRLLGWGVLAAGVTGAHFALADAEPILRMVGICCVLLGAMKGLVYAEWADPGKLSLARYLVFAFLWFGMDPASFRKRRAGLGWKDDIRSGVLHELAITLPVQSGFGLPTLYFTCYGLLTLLEKRRGHAFGRIPALLAVILPLGLLFPPAFQSEMIARCLDVFEIAAAWRAPPRS